MTVPASALEAYRSATEWKEFLHISEPDGVGMIEAAKAVSVNGLDVIVHDIDAYVEIYSLGGVPVYRGVTDGNAITLPSAGVYVLRMEGGSLVISVR